MASSTHGERASPSGPRLREELLGHDPGQHPLAPLVEHAHVHVPRIAAPALTRLTAVNRARLTEPLVKRPVNLKGN